MKVETLYDIGDRVTIDRDESIIGSVLAVTVRGPERLTTYEVAWFNNGNHNSEWFQEWRLDRWDA